MQNDLTRADVLLRDLENIGRGQMPAAQFAASTDGGPTVCGTCTRLGLQRLGVRLARSAMTARSQVVVYDNGAVAADGSGIGGVVQVFLADDPPLAEARQSSWWWVWGAGQLVLTGLCIVGLITVVRWLPRRISRATLMASSCWFVEFGVMHLKPFPECVHRAGGSGIFSVLWCALESCDA